MTITKSVAETPLRLRTRRSSAAVVTRTQTETFSSNNRTYRWIEGPAVIAQQSFATSSHDHAAQGDVFSSKIVPQMEKRNAKRYIVDVPATEGALDCRWIAWVTHESQVPVWGLFVNVRVESQGEGAPANDAFRLIAWGDGPALAWASLLEKDRSILRHSLRSLPVWLTRGMMSRDRTFPVKIEQISGSPSVESMDQGAVLDTAKKPEESKEKTENPVLQILREWKRAHGKEPFAY